MGTSNSCNTWVLKDKALPAYPDRKIYKRVQFAIPFGGGVKLALSKKVNLALEYKYRQSNTDYMMT
ncbi:MAG: hypothetical protein IPI66_08530 [Chitinophagaceae bacterium]|nr:hypothetical protein [Chitinophagaceae bacterium]